MWCIFRRSRERAAGDGYLGNLLTPMQSQKKEVLTIIIYTQTDGSANVKKLLGMTSLIFLDMHDITRSSGLDKRLKNMVHKW